MIPLLLVLSALADPCDPTCPPAVDLGAVVGLGPHLAPLPAAAEELATPLDRGFWEVVTRKKKGVDRVKSWVDLGVDNPDGRVHGAWVRVTSHWSDGTEDVVLVPLAWKERMGDGRERWGTTALEILPRHPWHGKLLSVDLSYSILADRDGDGTVEAHTSSRVYGLATPADLDTLASNLGPPPDLGPNADREPAPAPVAWAPQPYTSPQVLFAPYDDPQAAVQREIQAVIDAQRADPGGYHFIHASVYNINDPRIVDRLIQAHQAGVDVRILTDAEQMDPKRSYQTQYRRLQEAGVDLVGVRREGEFASNHTKLAVFDGQVAMTGSFNWEAQSNDDNNENLVIFRDPGVAARYEQVFQRVGGGAPVSWQDDPSSPLQIHYSRDHSIPAVLYRELENARSSITVAMFQLRHMTFRDGDQEKDVLDALVRARARGVKVTVLTERNIADAGEYHGRTTPDDPTDEWLQSQGVEVVEIHTNQNGNPYAALHHKFAVIDQETTLTGSANWFYGTQVSDDDLVVLRDPSVARRYLGEVTHLRRHYDPTFDGSSVPATSVAFGARHGDTRPGDEVWVVGDIPELGSWDPDRAVKLDGSTWPLWQGQVDIPAGTHFTYKYLVKRGDKVLWEGGGNRSSTASPDGGGQSVNDAWQ